MIEHDQPDQYLSEAFVKSLHGRVVQLETLMAENTDATNRTSEAVSRMEVNTRDIVDLFQSLEGGFKVLRGLGHVAKPLAYIVGLVTAVITAYSAWRGIK